MGLIPGQFFNVHQAFALTVQTDYKLKSDLLAETETGATRTTIGALIQVVGAIHTLKVSPWAEQTSS